MRPIATWLWGTSQCVIRVSHCVILVYVAVAMHEIEIPLLKPATQEQTEVLMLSRTWIWLALAFLVCGLASPVAGKQATFTVDVPPGRWKALRVQQLPK